MHPSSRTPRTPLPGPLRLLRGLTPGLFLPRPRGPLPAQRRRNSISSFHSHPQPHASPGWTSPDPCSKELGGLAHLGEWASAAQRRAVGNGCQAAPPSTQTKSFSPFLESHLERTQKCVFETLNSPLFLSEFLSGGNLVFLRFYGVGKRNHEMLGAKQGVQVRVNPG